MSSTRVGVIIGIGGFLGGVDSHSHPTQVRSNWTAEPTPSYQHRARLVTPELKELLEPFGISRFYTDDWGAYERNLDPKQPIIGKENTQKIERKHLTLRTRIKWLTRKTICFSKGRNQSGAL